MVHMNSSPRTLTRSNDDRKISGVSGGLASYLGVDPLLIRIGFVATALTTGLGFVAYIAMWALVPSEGHTGAATPSPA